MTQQQIQDAITTYGSQVVSEVQEVVSMSDADGAWSLFEDMGMFEHAACLEDLYF
jgi:hypothetical protein